MTFVYKTGDHDDVESQKTENEKTAYVRENIAYKKADAATRGDGSIDVEGRCCFVINNDTEY